MRVLSREATRLFSKTSRYNEDNAEHDRTRLERPTSFMASDPAKAISVTDNAREVGVSIRGLRLVFRHTGSGTAPDERRLAGAHYSPRAGDA